MYQHGAHRTADGHVRELVHMDPNARSRTRVRDQLSRLPRIAIRGSRGRWFFSSSARSGSARTSRSGRRAPTRSRSASRAHGAGEPRCRPDLRSIEVPRSTRQLSTSPEPASRCSSMLAPEQSVETTTPSNATSCVSRQTPSPGRRRGAHCWRVSIPAAGTLMSNCAVLRRRAARSAVSRVRRMGRSGRSCRLLRSSRRRRCLRRRRGCRRGRPVRGPSRRAADDVAQDKCRDAAAPAFHPRRTRRAGRAGNNSAGVSRSSLRLLLVRRRPRRGAGAGVAARARRRGLEEVDADAGVVPLAAGARGLRSRSYRASRPLMRWRKRSPSRRISARTFAAASVPRLSK